MKTAHDLRFPLADEALRELGAKPAERRECIRRYLDDLSTTDYHIDAWAQSALRRLEIDQ